MTPSCILVYRTSFRVFEWQHFLWVGVLYNLKNSNEHNFNADANRIPFNASYAFDDPDNVYWAHEYLLNEVIDEDVPIKERRCEPNKPPFMNSELQKAIYTKRMFRNKCMTFRSSSNWDNYRKQRNLVTNLKRQSLRGFFFERCHGWPKSKDFWHTINLFFSKKGSKNDPTILLNEDDRSYLTRRMFATF